MADITKEELMAFVEIQAKNAQQMERVATALQTIADDQKETLNALRNGIVDKIVERFDEKCKICRENTSDTAKDVRWIKIIFGSIALVTMVVIVILKFVPHN